MLQIRSPEFEAFLTMAEAVIRTGSGSTEPMRAAADRMFGALRTPAAPGVKAGVARLPVCEHLDAALGNAGPAPWPIHSR